MQSENANIIVELAKKANCSKQLVYKRIKQIINEEGKFRLPTVEDLQPRKNGRPRIYKY